MIFLSNYINGKQVSAISDKWQDVYNPATGKVYAQLPDSQAEDVEKAYKAAADAFPKWSETTVEYRSEMLEKIALAIEARHEELAQAESKDNGKPKIGRASCRERVEMRGRGETGNKDKGKHMQGD